MNFLKRLFSRRNPPKQERVAPSYDMVRLEIERESNKLSQAASDRRFMFELDSEVNRLFIEWQYGDTTPLPWKGKDGKVVRKRDSRIVVFRRPAFYMVYDNETALYKGFDSSKYMREKLNRLIEEYKAAHPEEV